MKAVWIGSPRPEQALKKTLVMGSWPPERHTLMTASWSLCVLIPKDPVPPRFYQFLNCDPASLLPGPEPPSSDCAPERRPPRDPGGP